MNSIYWFISAIILLAIELIYFRIAKAYKILDHPNNRTLHLQPTIRGGGVVFFFTAALYCIAYHHPSVYMLIGLALISIVGFVDDLRGLSSALRFALQAASLGLMFYGFGHYPPPGILVVLFVISIAALNAFNFMDGINGLTGGYSLVTLATLAYVNTNVVKFTDQGFIAAMIIGVVVFCFFNFRNRAVCFAGDVGSLSMGFIIIFMVVTLVIVTGNWMYLFVLSVYGADTGLTMIHRIIMKENIFKPHRHHLFQVIVYRAKVPHVQMSVIYMVVQAACNVALMLAIKQSMVIQTMVAAGQIVIFTCCYIMLKRKLVVNTVTG